MIFLFWLQCVSWSKENFSAMRYVKLWSYGWCPLFRDLECLFRCCGGLKVLDLLRVEFILYESEDDSGRQIFVMLSLGPPCFNESGGRLSRWRYHDEFCSLVRAALTHILNPNELHCSKWLVYNFNEAAKHVKLKSLVPIGMKAPRSNVKPKEWIATGFWSRKCSYC